MSEYICNLIVPGAAKSGTSTLHELLDRHPMIAMSGSKEPHHFSIDSRFAVGASAHNHLFTHAPQARYFGESSTTYMISNAAIRRITEHLTSPRIILVLRDPVERALSHYRWMRRLGLESRGLIHAMTEDPYDFDPNVSFKGNYRSYLAFSNYSKWVPDWISRFGKENVLLIRAEDMFIDQAVAASQCFAFLGLSDQEIDLPIHRNPTDSVTTTDFPWYLRAAARFVPKRLKTARFYAALRQGISSVLTNEVEDALADEERSMLVEALRIDLDFYESLWSE